MIYSLCLLSSGFVVALLMATLMFQNITLGLMVAAIVTLLIADTIRHQLGRYSVQSYLLVSGLAGIVPQIFFRNHFEGLLLSGRFGFSLIVALYVLFSISVTEWALGQLRG